MTLGERSLNLTGEKPGYNIYQKEIRFLSQVLETKIPFRASVAWSAQLDKRRSTKLEGASSNPCRTNTQGLKTTVKKVLP